jgi:UDP-glucose 4-epimerase
LWPLDSLSASTWRGAARPGDPPQLTASAAKFGMVAGEWRHYELDDMIQHAWAWYNRKTP